MNKATWVEAVLSNTDLSQVDPEGVEGVDFSTAWLQSAILSNGKPLGANYRYDRANFSDAHLEKAVLNGVTFVRTNFTMAHLRGADLSGADLTGAILVGADLTGATLTGTILNNADLTGTIFNGCDLTTTRFDPRPMFGTSVDTRTQFQNATVPVASLGNELVLCRPHGRNPH